MTLPTLGANGNKTWSGGFWEDEGFLLNKQHHFLLLRIWATQYFDLQILVDNKWIFIVFMSIVLYKTNLGEREGINIWDSKHLNASS